VRQILSYYDIINTETFFSVDVLLQETFCYRRRSVTETFCMETFCRGDVLCGDVLYVRHFGGCRVASYL
jgi:hypothetical protein